MENKGTGERVLGVILAGGLSRRMGGGDKGLLVLAGRPVLGHVIGRFAPQVDRLVLNANGDPARWRSFGLHVVPDTLPDRPGPLAGVLAAMDWAAENAADCGWLAAVPCDTPFLPPDLVARLRQAAGASSWAVAESAGRRHPTVALLRLDLRDQLAGFLAAGGRRAGEFSCEAPTAAFPAEPVDPFLNLNTPEQLAQAERLVVDSRRQRGDET
ncbi:MAG: molybdenum cofactor guanylyltransferase MobA [Alphaproteobacteria bacterium]|nr:molybdenum cofactor guanylyltransferase MobA [Alphaproteobacteria bacterium]